jgi:hypothetical protein
MKTLAARRRELLRLVKQAPEQRRFYRLQLIALAYEAAKRRKQHGSA